MNERQPNINKPSRLSRVTHNRLFQGVALTGMGGVAALAIAGAKDAHADYHAPVLDNKDSHSQPVNNQNSNSQIEVGGKKLEVTGFPQFKRIRSTEADASALASQLGEEITFTVPAGSNVNDQIHDQVLNRTGADLSGADTWKVVTAVGGENDNKVFPGQEKTYKVNEGAVSTIQEANVEVTVAVKAAPATVENQKADAGGTNISDQSENVADPTPTPGSVTEASVANSEATPVTCYLTDYKGVIEKDSDLVTSNPSVTHLQNIRPAGQTDCPPANVWFRTTAANQAPNTTGWLENQTPIISQITVHKSDGSTTLTSTDVGMVTVPDGATDFRVDVTFPKGNYCWIQEDVVRTSSTNVKDYSGDNMVNFAFYPNPDMDPVTCKPKPTVTPTNTATATVTLTSTSTNTPEAPTSTPTMKPSEFPNCEKLIGQPGNEAHYVNGTHWIVGDGLLVGKDDVYTVGNDNYTQCFCPPDEKNVDGDEGIQTNFISANTETKPAAKDGFFLIWGPDFGLKKSWYFASGADKPAPTTPNFDCNPKKPTETPTASPTATASPTVTFTSTATNTRVPESTNTPRPTDTAIPTNTKEAPTNTPVPPTIAPPARVELPKTGLGSENSKGGSNTKLMIEGLILAAIVAAAAARRSRALSYNAVEQRLLSLSPNALDDEEDNSGILARVVRKVMKKSKKGSNR